MMGAYLEEVMDFDGIVECTAMIVMMLSIFGWKYERKRMIRYAGAAVLCYSVLNAAVIMSSSVFGIFSERLRFVCYVVLIVLAGFLFSVCCLKGQKQQFLVTVLFFKSCVLFVSVLYKSMEEYWLKLIGNAFFASVILYLLGVVLICLSAWLCKKMTYPIHTRISSAYWRISSLTPIVLIMLWIAVDMQTDRIFHVMIYINALLMAVSFSSYALFIRLAREMEHQMDLELANQSLSFQVRQIDNTKALIEQTRTVRHELKNNYFYLETLLREEKYDEMQKFFDETVWPYFDGNQSVSTGNHLVDMILSQKVEESGDQGIPIVLDIQIPEDLKVKNMHPQILCSLMFNLLDNAIEASKQVENPDIYCAMNERKKYLFIEVRNKIEKSVLQSNPKLRTGKTDQKNHGIGMKMIRQAVEHCDGSIEISEKDGNFVVQLLLPEEIAADTARSIY